MARSMLSRGRGFQKAHTIKGLGTNSVNGLSKQDQAAMEAHHSRFGQDGSVVERVVDIDSRFKLVVFFIVLVSCLQMGACNNSDARHDLTCWLSDHGFVLLFAAEVLIRLMILRRPYFHSGWNQFDAIVLIANVIESWILTPLVDVFGWKLDDSFHIAMQFLRMSRILRIVRLVRQKPQLLMVIEGLVASLKSIIWVAAVLGLFIYTTAIFCVSVFNDIKTDCALNFSTVPDAFFTLFTLQILGDWTDIVAPVWQRFWWASVFFIAFIILGSFGILNLIIGVIAEKTAAVQESYRTHDRWVYDTERMQSIHEIADIIFSMQDDATISKEELCKASTDGEFGPRINDLVADVSLPSGLGITDCHAMFDRDASGSITQEEFTQGMGRLIFNNDFQKNFMVQSSIADVLAEIKLVERRIQKGLKRMECRLMGEPPPADDEPAGDAPRSRGSSGMPEEGASDLSATSPQSMRSPKASEGFRSQSFQSIESGISRQSAAAAAARLLLRSQGSAQSDGSAGRGVAPTLLDRNRSRSSELQIDTSQGRGIPELVPSSMPDLLSCRAIVQRLHEPLARLLAENLHAEAEQLAGARSPRSEATENVGEAAQEVLARGSCDLDTAPQPMFPPPRRCQNVTSIDKRVRISQPESAAAPPRAIGGTLDSFAERENSSNESMSELMARVAEMWKEPKCTAPPAATR